MKSFLCIPFLALNAVCMLQAQAATCSPEKLQEILQPASKQNPLVKINCSVTLPKNAQVSKQLLFAGQKASDAILDCNGATIQPTQAKLAVLITSLLKDDVWYVPQDIQIKNCTLKSPLRIHGMAKNGQAPYLRASSYQEGHTQRARQAAPHHIVLDNLQINTNGNMVYLAPGVHDVTLKNSRFDALTDGVALYMDAESGNNIIEKNTFNVQTKVRELIAVDGSANNIIRGNTFLRPIHGAIHLYRNCGEGGTIRHQTPSNNQIVNNRFELASLDSNVPEIWLASRNGKRKYCDIDAGYNFGSSVSNNDFAQNNTVADNTFVQEKPAKSFLRMTSKQAKHGTDDQGNLVRVDSEPNQVLRNKVID